MSRFSSTLALQEQQRHVSEQISKASGIERRALILAAWENGLADGIELCGPCCGTGKVSEERPAEAMLWDNRYSGGRAVEVEPGIFLKTFRHVLVECTDCHGAGCQPEWRTFVDHNDDFMFGELRRSR